MDNELTTYTAGFMKRTTPFKDNHSVQSKQLCLNQELLKLDLRTLLELMENHHSALQCTEVRFASFHSGGFITAIVVNPLERKVAKCTSVQRKIPG